MKKRALEKKLADLGWWFLREGGNHEMWTNGEHKVAVPRHREIVENTARAILKQAITNPGAESGSRRRKSDVR